MRMCLVRNSPIGPAPATTWMQTLGKPAASKRGATARVPRGAFRGGFDDQDITCGRGGRCLQDEGCDRGAEGVSGCTDSQWFVADELHKSIVGGEVVALLLVGPASIVQDCVLDVRLLPSWNDRCRFSGRKSVQCQSIDELFVHGSGQAVEALGCCIAVNLLYSSRAASVCCMESSMSSAPQVGMPSTTLLLYFGLTREKVSFDFDSTNSPLR